MTKPELIEQVAKQADLQKKEAAAAVDAVLQAITTTLKKGEKAQVSLIGFGAFGVRKRAARTGKNPRTGEAIKIAATKVAFFRPGKQLKTAVSGKK